MSKFDKLDEPKGTLRILTALLLTYTEIPKMVLMSNLHRMGLGATAFETSYKTLIELALIQEETGVNEQGNRAKMVTLTLHGKVIAEKTHDIMATLNET